MDDKLKKYIDKNRADFDNKEPSAELWKRIQTNIPQQPKVLVPQKKWNIGYWSIAASALILVSIGIYFMQNDYSVSTTKEQIVVKQKTEKVKQKEQINSVLEKLENKKSNQIEVVTHNKKIEIKETVLPIKEEKTIVEHTDNSEILSLLSDQQSTSNRINGIAKLGEFSTLNSEEKEWLTALALKDQNTIVRLNAIEVLSSKLAKTTASDEMTKIFMEQDNPMVQMELIGIIAHLNNDTLDQQLIKKLQEIVLDPKTMPFVKDEAYAVLLKKENNQ